MNARTSFLPMSYRPDDIIDWPAPIRVHIPLIQHQGRPGSVIVSKGEIVRSGQPLTQSDDLLETPIHASIAGTVEEISLQHISISNLHANDSALAATDNHGTQHKHSNRKINNDLSLFEGWSRSQFIRQIHDAGLVGLGGSCYPVAAKLNKLGDEPAEVLLINAAECDPSICCDAALLANRLDDIAMGIYLLQLATQTQTTIIGMETDKMDAAQSLLESVRNIGSQQFSEHTRTHIVPAQYPNGAESILMSHSLGRFLTSNDIQTSQLITFNVGTCYALSQALLKQRPYTHRITTVINNTQPPLNLRLPLGTPIADLVETLKIERNSTTVVGGEMMSTAVDSAAVITKASNCIQFKPVTEQTIARPCVRCGLCVDACPVNLMPQYLLAQANSSNYKNLSTLNLQHCIECTCCDRVCPSHIPLANIFHNAKTQSIEDARTRHRAELAKARFEKRQARLEHSKQREFRKLDKKQSTLNQSATSAQQAKRRLVEEALQRAKQKKQQSLAAKPNTDMSASSDQDKPS